MVPAAVYTRREEMANVATHGVGIVLSLVGFALAVWEATVGGIVLAAFRPRCEALAREGVALLVAGGFCYTGGALFYLWRSLPYHHAVWHVCVMAGSILHWTAVFVYVVPPAVK